MSAHEFLAYKDDEPILKIRPIGHVWAPNPAYPEYHGQIAQTSGETMEIQNEMLSLAANHNLTNLTLPPALVVDQIIEIAKPKASEFATLPPIPQLTTSELPPIVTNEPPTPAIEKPANALNHNPSEKFSDISHYGCDDEAYKRLLRATATILQKIPTTKAVDMIIDMPSWMRDDFTATQNVSPLINAMLASRLDDSPISNWESQSQIEEMRTAVAPDLTRHPAGFLTLPLTHKAGPLERLTIGTVPRKSTKDRVGIALSFTNPGILSAFE